jgi:integrase
MRVEDLQSKGSGWLIRLHEKGGKQHMMPCHHALAEALHAYIAAAGIAADKKGRRPARSDRGCDPSDRIH